MSTKRTSPPRAATVPLWIIQVFGMACFTILLLHNLDHPDLGGLGVCAGLILLSWGGRTLADVLTSVRDERHE